jgi:hypothetical protein
VTQVTPEHPTIERVRLARHEISTKFGHDPRRLGEYYLQRQKQTAPDRFFQPARVTSPVVIEGGSSSAGAPVST